MTEWEDGDRTLHRCTDLQDRRDIRNATGWFDRVADAFRTFGWDTAAENLRRYRSGTGEPKIYSRDEIERHDPILLAEDRNRTRFESGTLLGKTGNDVAKNHVLNIKDGETVIVHDDWDASIFFPELKIILRTPKMFGILPLIQVRTPHLEEAKSNRKGVSKSLAEAIL